ncbi:MAG: formate dehydrogenase accessory sulfurtransferase FdhD, partial [Pseudomonadota bacterium]
MSYIIKPNPDDPNLTTKIDGIDQDGAQVTHNVVPERPLTIFLNNVEVVTTMTIADQPKWLALGYLWNQRLIDPATRIVRVEYDSELQLVIVRTKLEGNQPGEPGQRLQKRMIRTSGCAEGTIFADMMEQIEQTRLPDGAFLETAWLTSLARSINTTESLYLKAGAIHGAVLAFQDQPMVYMEDVGRHNAIDKLAGWMLTTGTHGHDKILYTTGRLTSEMVIKAVLMEIPIVVSRSGFTAWGVELARTCNLTLIGRARGSRFIALSAWQRI